MDPIDANRSLLGLARRSTLICCLSIKISASSIARARSRSITVPTISLHKSNIEQQHRPILDQLPADWIYDRDSVRVMTDDRTQQLWVAATARDKAVDRVLDVIPEGGTARLLDEQFDSLADVASDMAPGEVRELCETNRWSEMN